MRFPPIFDKLIPYTGAVVGASAGLMVAGFWGVVVGGSAGLAYDRWRDFLLGLQHRDPLPAALPQGLAPQTTLALSVVAAARVYDLPVLRDDRRALGILKTHFSLDHNALRYIGKILRAPMGLTDAHVPLQQLKQMCGKFHDRARLVVTCLLDLADDQGRGMDAVSFDAIHAAALALGIPESEWKELNAGRVLQKVTDDAYGILGVSPQASGADITRVYRHLIREAHPDRWANVANSYARARLQQRAARLNAAYERLTKTRV